MSFRLVTGFSLAVCALNGTATADSLAAELQLCRELLVSERRLACYDALTTPIELAIEGKGSAVTELFEISQPRLLRFHSRDAIMIAYLLDENGDVVQNLHRGGAGAGEHVIDEPGQYRVQVNATGAWLLELEIP
ncbi:MAG: hypothetical protein AAFY35_17380 [Pseudomonadota bacterium]